MTKFADAASSTCLTSSTCGRLASAPDGAARAPQPAAACAEVPGAGLAGTMDGGSVASGIRAARAASPVQFPGRTAVISLGIPLTVAAAKQRPLFDRSAPYQPKT